MQPGVVIVAKIVQGFAEISCILNVGDMARVRARRAEGGLECSSPLLLRVDMPYS